MKKSLLVMTLIALMGLGMVGLARRDHSPTQESTVCSLPRANYTHLTARQSVTNTPPPDNESPPQNQLKAKWPVCEVPEELHAFLENPNQYPVAGQIQAMGYDDQIHPDEDLLQPLVPEPSQPSSQPLTSPNNPDPKDAGVPDSQIEESSESISSSVAVPALTAPPAAADSGLGKDAPPPASQDYDKNQPPRPDEDLLIHPEDEPNDSSLPGGNLVSPTPEGSGQDSQQKPETLPDPGTPDRAIDVIPHKLQPTSPSSTPLHVPASPDGELQPPGAPHGSIDLPPAPPGVDPHAEVFADTLYPSAKKCRTCHEQIYDEWASSGHAYAAISPMFQKFEQTINTLTRGTIGYFCVRCHAPVATAVNHPRHFPIYDSIPAAVEGVTCVACHRVREQYGRVNGERRIEPGSVFDPVYGSSYGEGLAEVLAKKDFYKVKGPDEKGPGQDIHQQVIHFEQISSSHFCVSCHQVAVYPGIALEVVWAQYRASPAAKLGITCQDCHMGREPGVADGYDRGPAAVVNGKPISPERKHSNHAFYGPGYSIAHPGVFPFHPDADDWCVEDWLQFDYRAGWGTDEFEDRVADGEIQVQFPKAWDNADDRYDARDIVAENLEKLEFNRQMRHRLMENGSHLEGPIFHSQPQRNRPLRFQYVVTNRNLGHNMPSGSLGAQPQLWLNVALTGPQGQQLWESGYVDANGDLADLHSHEVAAGRIRPDQQLFNLQTKFLITHVKGTDREMFLPINTDFDQLPFIRPSSFPITVMNHPPFIRMEAHSIAATGSRLAKYHVPAQLLSQPGRYRLTVRMRSRAEPIYFMKFCRATPEMIRNMNEWMLDYHEQSFDFIVP